MHSIVSAAVLIANCSITTRTVQSLRCALSRELDKEPALLIGALPADPAEYAALPGSFAPRPRSQKMVSKLRSVSGRNTSVCIYALQLTSSLGL